MESIISVAIGVLWCRRCGGVCSDGVRWDVRDDVKARRIAALGGKGILREDDVADLDASVAKVFEFMRDGEWHTATEIIEAAGCREGLRRMRDLRPTFTIDKRRSGISKREFEYRIVSPEEVEAKTGGEA
jgi:hypothetical protein